MIRIFIDQGHNPENPNAGAEGNGYREQDIVYEIGIILGELLTNNGNFEVKLSRPTADTQLGTSNATSLSARVDAANSWGTDWYISLHTNASEIESATGTEGFVYSLSSAAYPLVTAITASVSEYAGEPNRGVTARPSLYVLRRTSMPATLIELGFITNYSEANLMANSPGLYARAVYRGILEFFNLL
ncbi:MAG: N-acetylmuramoyl-L-alanine amidase [Firmicutes bacterium]|nr:N-acetylmuramoyl-L-alanine amidase [Bacillota bacterium]